MEITRQHHDGLLELRVQGRLDAYWSDHLNHALEESVRGGNHQIELDLKAVHYLSSAGIRVVLRYYKQLQSIKGSLAVIAASEAVHSVLVMSGLADVLIKPRTSTAVSTTGMVGRTTTKHAILEIYALTDASDLQCRVSGNPEKVLTAGFTKDDLQAQTFPEGTFGLGLGAFGESYEDCLGRFGEFIALGGAAAYQPTDGSTVPDYLLTTGTLQPVVNALYSVNFSGGFRHLIRFDARTDAPGAVPLGELVAAALDTGKSDSVGIVLIAETAGLVGASLQRSPAGSPTKDAVLGFPAIRDWLMFTTERAFDKSVCAVVGVASRKPTTDLSPFLRPIGQDTDIVGHFHAAVFPYRPLAHGRLNLTSTVQSLFGSESMQGLLHLLVDDRSIDGVGQSEFWRGACWVSPITSVQTQTTST